MSTSTIILIIIGALLLMAIHFWLHKLLKFKVDESAICHLFDELSKTEQQSVSLEDIAEKTQLKFSRASFVCLKSTKIEACEQDKNLWRRVS